MEGLIRSRVARTSAVATLLVLGGWGIAPYVLSDVGTSAFVNAEVTRVSSPIAGVVTPALPREGTYIDREQSLELVTARTPDSTHVDDLARQFSLKKAAIALIQDQLAEIRREQGSLAARTQVYHAAAMRDLTNRVAKGEADLRQCMAQLKDDEAKLEAARTLAAKGFVSKLGLRSAEASHEAMGESCRSLAAALAGLKGEQQAAGNGIYLSEGQSDAPYSLQQRDRLLIREQELMAQLVDSQAAFTDVQAQLQQEQARFQRSSHYRVTVPGKRLVWTLQTRPGAEVVEGETVMELADCAQPFVTVTLPARKIEDLGVGSAASIRLLGANRWINGHVRRIIGGAAKQAPPLYAAAMPPTKGDNFTVEVAYDSPPAPDAPRSCDIGRPAEVRFGRSLLPRAPAVAAVNLPKAG